MHSVIAVQAQKPDFVFSGFRRPDGKYRLYACRDIPAEMEFSQADVNYQVMWTLVIKGMKNMLVIDADTPGEAMARAFEIWANADAQKAIESAVDIHRASGGILAPLSRRGITGGGQL